MSPPVHARRYFKNYFFHLTKISCVKHIAVPGSFLAFSMIMIVIIFESPSIV